MNSVVYGRMLINDIRLQRKRLPSVASMYKTRPFGHFFACARGRFDDNWFEISPQTPEGIDMRKRTQKGFTLVELVVVIVILGILAAVALPRFVGLQGDARYAKLQAVAGSIKAASAMAHSAYLIAQSANTTPGTPVASVTIEGQSVALTHGYPSIAGIGVAANLSAIDGITIVDTASPVTVTVNGGPATCKVTYAVPASLGVPPTITLDTAAVSAC